jgi:hypothetical protein
MFVDQAVYKMGHKEDKKILHLQSISQHKEREKEREEQENNIFYSLWVVHKLMGTFYCGPLYGLV